MTVTPVRYEGLGQADFGWLKARYHFSFGRYHNPDRMGFGDLRVINDDMISPHSGFNPHGHANMEIITYVRRGAISHEDSLGNKGETKAGDIQVMSAGSGIEHAEYNREDIDTSLYQIWIKPREKGISPRWDSRQFPKNPVEDSLMLVASGHEEHRKNPDILYINADATLYAGRLRPQQMITHNISNKCYILVSDGEVYVDGLDLRTGDGAQITDRDTIEILADKHGAEILAINLEH